MEENEIDDIFGDVGNFDIPNIDPSFLDFVNADKAEETRYTMPSFIKDDSFCVMYENAEKLAKEIDLQKGQRVDAFVSWNFIFGDFIEAFLVTRTMQVKEMTIATLSLSQENIDSLHGLLSCNYIIKLNLLISSYFWGYERFGLIPYLYKKLDIDNRFQLAVANIHTKTVHFTNNDSKFVFHGSANLRSSGNVEQVTFEENHQLYDFYDEKYKLLIDKYRTINKAIRAKQTWSILKKGETNHGKENR